VRALSTRRYRLRGLLSQIAKTGSGVSATSSTGQDDADLAWLAAGKATVQLYGLILNALLEQTIPLSESIWYWDDVLGSYFNTGLYTVQTSPERFWQQAKDVYADAKEKFQAEDGLQQSAQEARQSLMEGWRQFYTLVQNSIQERSLAHAKSSILSPFAISRVTVRKKQSRVKRLRETNATAIGLIVDESLTFQTVEEEGKSATPTPDRAQWQSTIAKSVSLLEHILRNASGIDNSVSEFEESVFASVEDDPEFVSTVESGESTTSPSQLANRLMHILEVHLPWQEQACATMSLEYGKPSRLIRYWIPGAVLLLSGSTLLRYAANRRAEITQWFQEFGSTVRDFWLNWVIEPSKRLLGTIRHDEQSEIAIMSKDSLKADRESLERMVVDFAVEHPENGTKYTELQIAEIRVKVKEGDLTPVLKAYEREMQSPIKNVVMGELVRTLLIQIQKTKVDVEVAIGGIDSLLKSQELLFGFVGIAPGVLISYFVAQWLRGTFGGRRGLEQNKKKGETIRVLRFIMSFHWHLFTNIIQKHRPNATIRSTHPKWNAVLQRPRPPPL
jgi:nuclear control of ATPase protein 2